VSQLDSPTGAEFLLIRENLPTSSITGEGACVYDAIVGRIDWSEPDPWSSLLSRLNGPQRALVSVAQVHEHANFNGVQSTLQFHGEEFFRAAEQGATEMGHHNLADMITQALSVDPDWPLLEARWDSEAEFDDDAFVASNASAFFIDGPST
jgi:hypothetical protein